MATGKEVGALKGHEGFIRTLAMSPKSNLLASASSDRTIHFWDVATRREIGRSPGPAHAFMALSFSADGSVLASGDLHGTLTLWDVAHARRDENPRDGSQPRAVGPLRPTAKP